MFLDISTFLGERTIALPPLKEQMKYHRKTIERRITPQYHTIHVGVGEIGVGQGVHNVLRITALGSCVGLILIPSTITSEKGFYPTYLAHVMLPSRKNSQTRLKIKTRGKKRSNTNDSLVNLKKNLKLNQNDLNEKNSPQSPKDDDQLSLDDTLTAQKISNKGKYADIATSIGVNWFKRRGFSSHQIEAYIIGGARMFPNQDGITSSIGALNVLQTIKELTKRNVKVKHIFAGGITRKSIIIFVKEGEIYVRDGDDHFYYRLK